MINIHSCDGFRRSGEYERLTKTGAMIHNDQALTEVSYNTDMGNIHTTAVIFVFHIIFVAYFHIDTSALSDYQCKKTHQFITQCKETYTYMTLKQQKSLCLTPLCAKVQMCPYKTSCCVNQLSSTCTCDVCQT